jgi:hypothetical protein
MVKMSKESENDNSFQTIVVVQFLADFFHDGFTSFRNLKGIMVFLLPGIDLN